MRPALFLDRDGVIIENRSNYVRQWEDVDIYPQAMSALVQLTAFPCSIVIVTNQSAVGRQLITERLADEINHRLVTKIEEAGGRIERVYMCPHAPWENCECRKPKPGLFLRAAIDLSLDLSRSLMIGDAVSDLEAAKKAGVGNLALVLTGRGREQSLDPQLQSLRPFTIYGALIDAVAEIKRQQYACS